MSRDGLDYTKMVMRKGREAGLEMGSCRRHKHMPFCDLIGQRRNMYNIFGNINTSKMVNYINKNSIIPLKW